MEKDQEKPSELTVKQFAEGMYDDGSDYLVYRQHRGRELSWNHRRHCATYLRTYILPYFGSKPTATTSMLDIEAFQDWLLKQPSRNGTLTPSTANHIVQAMRSVIRWAIHQRELTHDPFVGVEPLATQSKRRGIFTIEEVKRIFEQNWPDPRSRMMNALACVCGLRKGEVQGLRKSSVQELALADGRQAAVLLIDQAWERSGQLKSPKSGKTRLVPIPPGLFEEMQEVVSESVWDFDCLIFYGTDPWKPISHHKIDDDFQRALAAAGIPDSKRLERRLSFHSWRHFANSFMVNQGIPTLKVQQLIGHTSLNMTKNYLHQRYLSR